MDVQCSKVVVLPITVVVAAFCVDSHLFLLSNDPYNQINPHGVSWACYLVIMVVCLSMDSAHIETIISHNPENNSATHRKLRKSFFIEEWDLGLDGIQFFPYFPLAYLYLGKLKR